ncbi:MAG: hypothetical protein JSV88_25410 [Candidatus Aminicenantes bacterium]|nr:MAG: hypothetical protein JSV88_25410 [Candidatus Aminicenantes bacterium]
MIEVTVKIPEDMKDIAAETSETIYVEALKEVTRKRMSDYQKRLIELKEKITIYENTYGKSFEEFSQGVPDTLEGHDDWIDWSYLVRVAGELENKINKLKILCGN